MENMLENKKVFKKPELEIVDFTNDDIITESFGSPTPGDKDVFGWW